MNKKQCLQLIDKLSDKTLNFGCMLYYKRWLSDTPEMAAVAFLERHKDYEIIAGYITGHGKEVNGKYNVNGVYITEDQIDEILGHPPKIGDVLEKMVEIGIKSGLVARKRIKLIELWYLCGFNKSMVQIMEESGFEEDGYYCKSCGYLGNKESLQDHLIATKMKHRMAIAERLKDPKARALFEFINNTLK